MIRIQPDPDPKLKRIFIVKEEKKIGNIISKENMWYYKQFLLLIRIVFV